jgi:hypothetical protein
VTKSKKTDIEKPGFPKNVLAAALFVFLFSGLFSYFVLDHIPHIHDEIGYLFQAKIFKSGHFYVDSPCSKESFDFPHIINNGKWYSQYPPGFPLLLVPFLFLSIPWLVNPFLGFVSILLFYLVGTEIYDRKTGILTAALGSLSIWLLLMSSTFLSHTSCMFFLLIFLLFLFRSLRSPSITHGLLTGIGWGAAFLIRPYTTILFSFPFLIYFLVRSIPCGRKKFKNMAAAIIAAVICLSILMLYNQATNGHPFRMGYTVRYGETHGVGFNKTGFTDIPHTPMLGVTNTIENLSEINQHLFGWPLSSFLALIPLLLIRKIRPEYRKKDLLLGAGILSFFMGNFFYWAALILLGARLFFETLPLFVLLSARGIREIPQLLKRCNLHLSTANLQRVGIFLLILLTIHAFFIHFPKWIHPEDQNWYYYHIDKDFQGTTSQIHKDLRELSLDNALIIMNFLYHPMEYFPGYWWRSGFIYNDPELNNDIIYARDQGKNNQELFSCFPERRFYIFTGTIDKGLLQPLFSYQERLRSGDPILLPEERDKSIKLIKRPLEFFHLYSLEFKDFLEEFYSRSHPSVPGVPELISQGNAFVKSRDYQKGAFCFEAALQIEKNPKVRFRILGHLALCYTRTGQTQEAKNIYSRIQTFKPRNLYTIFPERGF